jgi:hypothetical protein
MNSALTSKLKPLLAYVVPVAMMCPSLIWIILDKSVWTWDPALYGKNSVELFFTLIYAPTVWISHMLDVLRAQAPGVSWFGQFFVPLGYALGSIDLGLLLSIWVTQALTLVLMYRSVGQLSGQNHLISIAGCLVIASAPLFVGMSHQYFAEPLQLLAVAWFVMIMSFAPKWNRAFVLSQLVIATPVAMLAKGSSPLYCVGPGLVGLWYVFKPNPPSFVKHERRQKRIIVTLAVGVLLNFAAGAWYYRNITHIIQHVSIASSGPVAELYGKKDSFLNAMLFWLGGVQNSFFLPVILSISGLIFVLGVMHYVINSKTRADYFTICSAIAVLQILIVLSTFSLNTNRDLRFLLPLLPYLALLICWSAKQINIRLLTIATMLMFFAQLTVVYQQASGVASPNPNMSHYVVSINMDNMTALTVDAIVSKTCTETRYVRYWNIVGDSRPWLNVNTLAYTAAKKLMPENRLRCYYGYVGGYFESDLDKTWSQVTSLSPLYYITSDPDIYPIPPDKLNQAINQLNIPLLDKIQTSDLFKLEPALREDPGILIFRREKPIKRVDYGEASMVSEHGVQSVRAARFGENFELLGALLTPAIGRMELKLAWRCVREARLEYMVAVHFVDEAGNILAQSDFAQDVEEARVIPGAVWVDRVSVPAEKLKGARHVAIALYIPGRGVEPIDRGPRDWGGRRLLLPLEKARTREAPMWRE